MVYKIGGLTIEGGVVTLWILEPKYLAAEILEKSERNFRENRNVLQNMWQTVRVIISSFISLRAANFCLLLAGYLTLRGFN